MELLIQYRGTLITAVIAVAVGLASYAVVSNDPLAGHRDRPFTMDFSRLYDVDPALIRYEQTRELSVPMDQPRCISVGPEDQIYVGGDQTVGVYRQDGTTLAMIPTEGRPDCLGIGNGQHVAPGRIYVGSGTRIEVFDGDGSRVATWNVPTDGAILASIAVADESVFVADAGNRVVWRFDPSGALLGTIGHAEVGGRTFNVPSTTFDIAIGSNGQLHVANPGALRIETYTFDGALQVRWGNPGAAIENFFGCCNPSQFAVLPGGEIVTLEKGVPRIKLYSEYGEFRSVVAGPQQLGIAQSELGDARPHQSGTVFDVAADSQGRVLVLDPRRKSVRVFMRRDEHTSGIGIHLFPGSAWEHTGSEAPPRGLHAACGRATPELRSKAEHWNEIAAPLNHLFPGSAWEHRGSEAPPRGLHAACRRATPELRSKAEHWNELAAPLSHLFPGSAWEHTGSEAPPRGLHVACGGATPELRSKAEPWNEVAAPLADASRWHRVEGESNDA